jgi:hypothetical protein
MNFRLKKPATLDNTGTNKKLPVKETYALDNTATNNDLLGTIVYFYRQGNIWLPSWLQVVELDRFLLQAGNCCYHSQ